MPCFHLANKRILSPIIWAGYTHQRFLTILKGGATPADCTRPCGYARCICPSSFASVTSSFAFAAEDKLSRFSLLLFRACPHCTRLSFVCQALFSVAFKRYTVGTSRSCCCVSRLTRLDCTRLLIDCQALFCGVVRLPSRLSPVYHTVGAFVKHFFLWLPDGLLPSPSLARPLYHSRAHLSTLFQKKILGETRIPLYSKFQVRQYALIA